MNPAPSFTELLNSLSPNEKKNGESSWNVTITENWMQGRTTYSSLSSALCLK